MNRNLPFKITAEEMYDVFGKYGAIRQIRVYVFILSFIYDWNRFKGKGEN